MGSASNQITNLVSALCAALIHKAGLLRLANSVQRADPTFSLHFSKAET